MSGRLARGRSYAKAGQVLDFELPQGKVTARVQGSRVRPYQVRIGDPDPGLRDREAPVFPW
jgi:uncharacterized Zn finger protein